MTLCRLATGLIGVIFLGLGLGWWGAPGQVAPLLGMEVLSGPALSTQLADLAAFFLTVGSCALLGVVTGRRVWLWPALMLVGFALLGRVLAWLVHGAPLAASLIAGEAVVVAVLGLCLARGGSVARAPLDRRMP